MLVVAEQGLSLAQCHLGRFHAGRVGGDRIPRDFERAFQLFNLSAAQGNALAAAELAHLHREGLGVAQGFGECRRQLELSSPVASHAAMQPSAIQHAAAAVSSSAQLHSAAAAGLRTAGWRLQCSLQRRVREIEGEEASERLAQRAILDEASKTGATDRSPNMATTLPR